MATARPQLPDWLLDYLSRGFRLVFYPKGSKHPIGRAALGWTSHTYTPEDYRVGDNVGVVTGHALREGHYLTDIDFDWQEGVPLASHLLPPTGFGFGRGNRAITHAFYTTSTPLPIKSYDDIDGKPFVELRGTKADGTLGLQTMIPPSVHPSGDVLKWAGPPSEIAHNDALGRQVLLYAIACILLKYLGHRGLMHDQRLHAAGFLLNQQLEEQEVTTVLQSVCLISGNDVNDVAKVVESTAARIRNGEKVTGGTSLAKAIGENGRSVLSRLREWISGSDFKVDKNGRAIPNQENIRLALEKLNVQLAYNEFQRKPVIIYNGYNGPLEDRECRDLRLTTEQKYGFLPSKELFTDVLLHAAEHNGFHPVRDYLSSLHWDKVPRIDEWLIRYAGVADNEYVRAVSPLILLAAVRRVKHPGCKFDEILILEGGQGIGKSSFIAALCPNHDWFGDDLPLGADAKEVIEQTSGKWIIEAAELYGNKRDVDHIKAFASRCTDGPVRMAYDRMPIEQKRQFIIIGSTNNMTGYFKDDTGNRRFWPVEATNFDLEGLRAARDQLWAEAVLRETDASIRLDPKYYQIAADEQEQRRAEDPWEPIIETAIPDTTYVVPIRLIWEILEKTSAQWQNPRDAARITAVMQRLGFTKKTKRRIEGEMCWCWVKPRGDLLD